jgi:hypothetical protein
MSEEGAVSVAVEARGVACRAARFVMLTTSFHNYVV